MAQTVSDVYERLYHYTNLRGLLGILNTKRLWATHCKFLNDYSEIVLFKDKLVEFLSPHVLTEYKTLIAGSTQAAESIEAEGGLGFVAQRDTTNIVDAMYKVTTDEFYIASFCGEHKDDPYINEHGLLSQWRGYGEDGGLAVVFRTEELEKLNEEEGKQFDYSIGICGDVIYSDDEVKFEEELSDQLATIAAYVKKFYENVVQNRQKHPNATNVYPAFVECIGRYKHRGFKEENEVRILVQPARHSPEYLQRSKNKGSKLKPDKERKFREARGNLIPYIELFDLPNVELPIERIIVGPHRDKEARAASLRVMLRNTDINISVSDIPYVCKSALDPKCDRTK